MLGFFTDEASTARPLGDTSTRTITTSGVGPVPLRRAGTTGSNRLVTDGRVSTCAISKIWPRGTASAWTEAGGGAAAVGAATTGGGVATSSGADAVRALTEGKAQFGISGYSEFRGAVEAGTIKADTS